MLKPQYKASLRHSLFLLEFHTLSIVTKALISLLKIYNAELLNKAFGATLPFFTSLKLPTSYSAKMA